MDVFAAASPGNVLADVRSESADRQGWRLKNSRPTSMRSNINAGEEVLQSAAASSMRPGESNYKNNVV